MEKQAFDKIGLMYKKADVVKLVYTPDLGSGALRRGGSSPLVRTMIKYDLHCYKMRTWWNW